MSSRPSACKSALSLAAIVLGALALSPPSLAAPVPPPQPLQDSVTGGGSSSSCGGEFVIDARSGPSGENPTGHVNCGPLFNGPVVCLNVSGNVAVLTVQSSGNVIGPIAVRITDIGFFSDRLETFPIAFGCPTALDSSAYIVFSINGDLVVTDAPAVPTSKEQCKNGGYAQFGFKNQGQCVAFVHRGPKP